LIYWLHQHSLAHATTGGSGAMLHGAASTTIVHAGPLPRSETIVRAVLLSPVQTLLLLAALVLLIIAVIRLPSERFRLVVLAGCAAPLLSLLVYRNAFPYFFPFILPSAMVLVAWMVTARRWPAPVLMFLALSMTVWAALVAHLWSERGQTAQRQLVSAVHRMFPRPVMYIDRNSIIPSFPKRGFFMSTWGMLGYRAGPPLFAGVLSRDTVPLVIVDGPALEDAFGGLTGLPNQYALLDEDKRTLRDNYIHHWGPVWVAGKTLQATRAPADFAIAVPGIYTLKGGAVSIDGKTIPAGGKIDLARGVHRVTTAQPAAVTLTWGNHLWRPTNAFEGPIYRGF
jgi:hypothetical protein